MNAPAPVAATARVDREGRLVAADPAIEALNRRAGGAVNSPLAIPPLAIVARLAARLGIPVSRAVTVADEEADLDLVVRAEPDGDGVNLAVSGWRELPNWLPRQTPEMERIDAGRQWETDAALRLTYVQAVEIAGIDPVALLGQPLAAVFAMDDGEELLAGRQPFDDRPARLRTTGRPVILSASVRRDGSGGFAGLSGGARPVEASAEVDGPALPDAFTGGLDRALRTPLARIVANADSMSAQADGPIAPAYAEYAADIAGAGRHLLALIDDLVDLQAIERPGFALAVEPIDLADVGRRAAGLLGVRAADGQVAVERPAGDIAVSALGDFRRALQVVVNLLVNAIRYSPAGASVRIEVRRAGAQAMLIVTDEGKGIAGADQARIFDKFGRVDLAEEGGNGLGLYIARRLARAMGGDLVVESAPGEGARFTFSLAAPSPDRPA